MLSKWKVLKIGVIKNNGVLTLSPPFHPNRGPIAAVLIEEMGCLNFRPLVGVPCVSPNHQSNVAQAVEDEFMGNKLVGEV